MTKDANGTGSHDRIKMSYWYRLLRLTLALVIILSVLAGLAIAALPFIISTDSIRLQLAQGISAWTGYSVEIRQPPRLTFFPAFRASLKDVTVSRIGSDDNQPLMQAERIEVELSLIEALMGRISFTETRLIQPEINLIEPVSDLPQFINTIASSNGRLGQAIREAREIVGRSANKPDIQQLVSLPFGRMVIENGTLHFQTRDTLQPEQITAIYATLDWPQTASAATIKGNSIWHDEPVQFNATINQALLLLANGMSQISLQLTSKPISMAFNGKANISKDLFSEGKLTVNTDSLSGGLRWAGLSVPVTGNPDALSLESNVSITSNRIKLADIILDLNKMPAKGAAEIGLDHPLPLISGTLAFQTLDTGSLFNAISPLISERLHAGPSPDRSDEIIGTPTFDVSLLELFNIDMRFSAQSATVGPIEMTSLAAALQLRDGQAIIDIGDAKAFQGNIQAQLTVSKSEQDDQAKLSLRANGTNIASSNLLSTLGLKEPFLRGHGNLSATASTNFSSWAEIIRQVHGQFTLTLQNGRMQGFDINDFIKKMNNGGFFALQRLPDVGLDFSKMEIKATIADGVATIENAQTTTASGILQLGGIIPFIDHSLALSGSLSFPDKPNQTDEQSGSVSSDNSQPQEDKAKLHFFVGGSWDQPFISPAN